MKKIIATTATFLIVMSSVTAGPPKPDDPTTPVGGGPIDDYLPLLFIAALLLGVWALNKYKTLDQVKS